MSTEKGTTFTVPKYLIRDGRVYERVPDGVIAQWNEGKVRECIHESRSVKEDAVASSLDVRYCITIAIESLEQRLKVVVARLMDAFNEKEDKDNEQREQETKE